MLEPSGLLIGESASFRAFREELGYAARCDAPVLLKHVGLPAAWALLSSWQVGKEISTNRPSDHAMSRF